MIVLDKGRNLHSRWAMDEAMSSAVWPKNGAGSHLWWGGLVAAIPPSVKTGLKPALQYLLNRYFLSNQGFLEHLGTTLSNMLQWDGRLPSQRPSAAAESARPGAEAQLGRPWVAEVQDVVTARDGFWKSSFG